MYTAGLIISEPARVQCLGVALNVTFPHNKTHSTPVSCVVCKIKSFTVHRSHQVSCTGHFCTIRNLCGYCYTQYIGKCERAVASKLCHYKSVIQTQIPAGTFLVGIASIHLKLRITPLTSGRRQFLCTLRHTIWYTACTCDKPFRSTRTE